MKTLEIRVQEVISVADIFGKQIKKTFEKIGRVFSFCVDAIYKMMHALFSNPSLRPRPPTVNNLLSTVNPPNMVFFAVLGGFIL